MKTFVTGCAGFVGSNLVDRLLSKGFEVVGVDNLSTGRLKFLSNSLSHPRFKFYKMDLCTDEVDGLLAGVDIVFHLSANADVRFGLDHPRRDVFQNTIVTHNLLESVRKAGVRRFAFSSTGSVYGEAAQVPTPEDAPFPVQTSLYGASKVAAEGLVSAYSVAYDIKSYIFRFVSILGPRYSHGHVFDFVKSLKDDPNVLTVLGNGFQRKSYLHIEDCIDAMLLATNVADDCVNIFNLGFDGVCSVRDSVSTICRRLGLRPKVVYGDSSRGWVGDSPLIHLDTSRIRKLGWEPKFGIEDSIVSTVEYLNENKWLFDRD